MRLKTTCLLVGLAAAGMLIAASPAMAELTRPNTLSFGTEGNSTSTINNPNGLAFHQSSKRLYSTSQSSPNGIFGFDASTPGTYTPLAGFNPLATVNPSGLAGLGADNSGVVGHDGNVYLSSENTNKLYGFDSTGAALAAFGGANGIDPAVTPGAPSGGPSKDICGAAVDPAGNVWIGNYSTKYVIGYKPNGEYLESINTSSLGSSGRPCQLAFDSNGDMYVQIYNNSVWKLEAPEYTAATKLAPYEGGPTFPRSVGVDGSSHHVFVSYFNVVTEYDPSGNVLLEFGRNIPNESLTGVVVNEATDEVHVGDSGNDKVHVFGPPGIVPDVTTGSATNVTRTAADIEGHVELAGGGNITECKVEYGTTTSYTGGSVSCNDALPIEGDQDITAQISGLTAQTTYHYRVKAGNANGPNYGADQTFTTANAVKDLETLDATEVGLNSAILNGSFDRDGYTTNYYLQWTYQTNQFTELPIYNNFEVSAAPPGPEATTDNVSFIIPSGLLPGKTYYYRLIASNSFGTTIGQNVTFYTSSAPSLDDGIYVSHVSTDQATIHLTGNPNGLSTTYHIEYGTEGDCASSPCISLPEPEIFLGAGVADAENEFELTGLDAGTTYHYRIVMSNAKGTVTNVSDHTFTTFPNTVLPPPCPNDLARQQTGAALLLDCRAFELVSAPNTGGYDVESSLAPGQKPYGGYPQASEPSQVLYGIHEGAIPGIAGNPTNKGLDPYRATRTNEGWTTEYVGIPANGTPSTSPFSSTLLAADSGLDTFAFGGPDLCAPCFGNGATGIPMRLPDGSLVQGMAGENDPGAAAAPDGMVAKPFSADGTHFVFGSVKLYQPDGNNNTGDVSIYDRNLETGVTQVVSKTPAGANLPCLQGVGQCHSPGNPGGISQLDISEDGSRIIVGQLVGEDDAGNDLFQLYMHIGNDPETVDLTPGTTTGAHFAGMTADGSTVYFTTRDPLTTASDQDTDASVDLFSASVDDEGDMTLARVSTGVGAGNTDSCDPSGNSRSPDDWNTAGGGPTDCSVVAVGGGGGVASGDGTIYFLSPEELDGGGEVGSPNLFVVRPGSSPEFVRTLASNANHPFAPERHLLDYEITGFSIPSAAAIDHATGDFYVLDNAWRYPNFQENEPPSFVQKFNSNGELDQSFGTFGKIDGSESPTGFFRELGKIGGNAAWGTPDSIAVDNTCADLELSGNACTSFDPSNGYLYVPDFGNDVVDKFDSDGNYVSQIDVTEIVGTINVGVRGVEIDPSTGKVFVAITGGGAAGGILIYDNQLNNQFTGENFASNQISNAVELAIDSAGYVYVTTASFSGSTIVRKYAPPYTNTFTVIPVNEVSGIAYDITTDHLYFDRGNRVEEYTTEGVQVGPTFGTETLEESYGLDAYDGRVIVSNKGPQTNDGKFSIFTEPRIPPDKRHDDSLVIDSVLDGDTRHTEDFQVTPDGDIAAFASAVLLSSYDPKGRNQVYRYDQPAHGLLCVSCPPTNADATGDATLASNGLNLTDDGRMLFTTTEALVLRDTNGKEDVYEWKDGEVQPISPGQDRFGSKLLTVSADGKDAYFFTHATLAPQDRNGGQAKIYDARENGGFFVVPPQPPCVASDECHGPGTQAAPPPDIGSYGGTPTRISPRPRCRRGQVRRRGRCVRRHRSQRKRRHRRHASGHKRKRHTSGKRG